MPLFPIADNIDTTSVQRSNGLVLPTAGISFDSDNESLVVRDPVTALLVTVSTGRRLIKVPITHPAGSAVAIPAYVLPEHSILSNLYVNTLVPEATGTTKLLYVGLKASEGGDEHGFATMGVSAAGVQAPRQDAQTAGSYLLDTASIIGGPGSEVVKVRSSFSTFQAPGSARTVVYTAGSNDWAEFVGELWLEVLIFDNTLV